MLGTLKKFNYYFMVKVIKRSTLTSKYINCGKKCVRNSHSAVHLFSFLKNIDGFLMDEKVIGECNSGAYPGIGQGGGTSHNFLLGLLKCRFLYLQRTVMERCIFACFLLIPHSYEHIGRQYTYPRLYSVH